MTANPQDIAQFTTDGVLVISPVDPDISTAIAANHVDARDGTSIEIEHFFDLASDSQAMLDELFALRSRVQPLYLAVEIEDDLGLGYLIEVAPTVPCFRIVDEQAGLSEIARLRAYAVNYANDRYSVELIE